MVEVGDKTVTQYQAWTQWQMIINNFTAMASHILDIGTCNRLIATGSMTEWFDVFPMFPAITKFYPLFDSEGNLCDITTTPVEAPFVLKCPVSYQQRNSARIDEDYAMYKVFSKLCVVPITVQKVPVLRHKDGSLVEHEDLAEDEITLTTISWYDQSAMWQWSRCQYEPRNRYFEWIANNGFIRIQFTIHIPNGKKPDTGPFRGDKQAADPKYQSSGTKDHLDDDYIKATGVYAMMKGGDAYLLGKDHKWHLVNIGDTFSGSFLRGLFYSNYSTQPYISDHQYTILQMDAWEKLKDIVEGKLMRIDLWVRK